MKTPKEVSNLIYEYTSMSIFYTQEIAKDYLTVADKARVRRIIKKFFPSVYKQHSMQNKSWQFYKTRNYFIVINQLTTHYFRYERIRRNNSKL